MRGRSFGINSLRRAPPFFSKHDDKGQSEFESRNRQGEKMNNVKVIAQPGTSETKVTAEMVLNKHVSDPKVAEFILETETYLALAVAAFNQGKDPTIFGAPKKR
jgi:hypothetical protein